MKPHTPLSDEFTRMDEERKKINEKIKYALYVFSFLFFILTARLWYLQIHKGLDLKKYSENNRLKKQVISAPRGLIFSQGGGLIARNHLESKLVLIPQHSKDIKKTAQTLSPIIGEKSEEIERLIEKSKKERGAFYPYELKKELSLKQIYRLKLLKTDFPELDIQEYMIRSYPAGALSQLIGYTGAVSKEQAQELKSKRRPYYWRGSMGQSGIEKAWEEELGGKDGLSFIEVNAWSRRVLDKNSAQDLWPLPIKKAVPGRHLVLTIDQDIQEAALHAMDRKDRIGKRKGAVIVMKTGGEILAWLSLPYFDSNLFSKIIPRENWKKIAQDSSQFLLNKAIQNHYAPASTIKPFIALAALQEKIIDKNTLIDSPGRVRLGRRFFHDHNIAGYGKISITEAIERSSNTFFYQIGQKLGMDVMADYLSAFGFGQKTGVRLPGEIKGFVPTKKWKLDTFNEPWQAGEDLIHAIGQGYTLTTPLQLISAYNVIASGGKRVRPFIVKSVIHPETGEVKNFSSKVIQDLSPRIDEEHFQTVREALEKVVSGANGTARWWKMKKGSMAGKTGTSQTLSFDAKEIHKDCMTRKPEQRHHGWFIAFAPALKPEITVLVLTENSCSGSSGSVPIARDIVRAYLKKYHPKGAA